MSDERLSDAELAAGRPRAILGACLAMLTYGLGEGEGTPTEWHRDGEAGWLRYRIKGEAYTIHLRVERTADDEE